MNGMKSFILIAAMTGVVVYIGDWLMPVGTWAPSSPWASPW